MYHDDLLAQALQLIQVAPPSQLTLRRAVSAAYYAVFHFLIAEATSNWASIPLRTALGRAYDHGVMKTASNRILNAKEFPFTGENPAVAVGLRFVANHYRWGNDGEMKDVIIISKLLDMRHVAGYGTG